MDEFKPAEDLGLSQKEHNVLVDLLGRMDRGELTHAPADPSNFYAKDPGPWIGLFNMAWVRVCLDGCGTTCCILGAAREISQDPDLFNDLGCYLNKEVSPRRKVVDTLFFPADEVRDLNQVTVQEAADRLRTFLVTGTCNQRVKQDGIV